MGNQVSIPLHQVAENKCRLENCGTCSTIYPMAFSDNLGVALKCYGDCGRDQSHIYAFGYCRECYKKKIEKK